MEIRKRAGPLTVFEHAEMVARSEREPSRVRDLFSRQISAPTKYTVDWFVQGVETADHCDYTIKHSITSPVFRAGCLSNALEIPW